MIRELSVAPVAFPITVQDAKDHLNITVNDDDGYISDLIAAATEYVEDVCSNRFMAQTWKAYLNDFPVDSFLYLPFGKVKSVTSVKYTDYLNTTTTWAASNYTVDTVSSPGKIDLAYNVSWPEVTLKPVNGVVVEWVTGYTAVPAKIKQAIKILVAHFYENREAYLIGRDAMVAEAPLAVGALVADYRMVRGV